MFMPVHKVVQTVVLPLKENVYQANIFFQSFSKVVLRYPELVKIMEEKMVLKKTKEELELANQILKEENLKLRHQLEAPLPPFFQFIPATVVSVSRKMELFVGGKEKIIPGMAVVEGTTLIGKIDEVQNNRSTVLLVSDPESQIPARTSRGARGIVVGYGKEMVILDKILQKELLFLDDTVFTSGEGGFPPNLLIGKVVHIKSEDVSPYKQAKLEIPIVYDLLKTVFIISQI